MNEAFVSNMHTLKVILATLFHATYCLAWVVRVIERVDNDEWPLVNLFYHEISQALLPLELLPQYLFVLRLCKKGD